MKELLIFLILLMFSVSAYGTTVYKWVDKRGVVNFSDDYTKVPPAFRDRVKSGEYAQQGKTIASAKRMVPATKEEIKTDVYGRDETWWRGKVRPWEEELKEASEKYENAQKEYMEQAEGLGPYNFGKMSLTQYQMLSSRLEVLRQEMEMYQGQMAEADEMLNKLSKEAKETGADPAWLE
jgi:hypothetical protein